MLPSLARANRPAAVQMRRKTTGSHRKCDSTGIFAPGRLSGRTGSAKNGSKPAHRRTGRQKRPVSRRRLTGYSQRRLTGRSCPLSNPAETINLGPDSRAGNRAGPGSCQPASMCLRRSGGRPIFQVPIRPTGRTGSGDLEKKRCWVRRGGSRQSRSRVGQDALSGHPFWNFERLSHVSANLQSLFVRAGKVICFCSPNEQ
jgi:hypothetical protein